MSKLTSALHLPCGITIPNRIGKSAMTEGLADEYGHATQYHEHLYRQWSQGGAGLLITGNIMVDRTHLERAGNVVLEDESGMSALKAYAQAGTEAGNQLWVQINHPGRQCVRLVNPQPFSPSSVRLNLLGNFGQPKVMSESDIHDVIKRYVTTAKLAQQAGFTGVQIHSAHGYLSSQFLSPITNKREDQWGGSLENRARFLLTIVKETRKALGQNFPISVKLNSADFQKGGFSFEECQQVVAWLDQEGIDLLEISGGTYEQFSFLGDQEVTLRDSTQQREAYFLEYAKAIRKHTRAPLMITGGFRSLDAMNQALEREEVDMIGLARPLCVYADYPKQLLNGTLDRLPSFEHQLSLGRGKFGINSPWSLFKLINVQGQVGWFYRQIIQMAHNQPPLLNWGVLKAFYRHALNDFKMVMARNKALKAQQPVLTDTQGETSS